MELSEFLLARLAEDEALAQAVVDDMPRWDSGSWEADVSEDGGGLPAESFITRMSPARVLADVAAKRRIMEVVEGWTHLTVEDCWYSCPATYDTDVEDACCNDHAGTECTCGRDFRARAVLAPLAQPYADHPDFDPTWRL